MSLFTWIILLQSSAILKAYLIRSHVTNAYSFEVQRAFLDIKIAFDLFLYTTDIEKDEKYN